MRVSFQGKKQQTLPIFEPSVRYKISLEIGNIMRTIHICLLVSNVYPKQYLV